MRLRALIGCAVLMAVLGTIVVLGKPAPGKTPVGGESVVLLELFTSQGCSSCPPADRLLSEIANDPELRDRVVPLAFHVDYWNRLGWRDPFSSRQFSNRQRAYGKAFSLSSVYTPQVVVQGQLEMVGSRERQVRQALRQMLRRPFEVSLDLALSDSAIEVSWHDHRSERSDLDLYVVIVEDGLVTDVRRGENRDRKLRNDRVVRHLENTGRVAVSSNPEGTRHVEIRTEPDWNRDHLGVAVFLQDPDNLEIVGVTEAPLSHDNS